jgi:hypothetical protein
MTDAEYRRWQHPVQAVLPIGADRAGEDHGPGCPHGHHEVTVPQAPPLTVILLGSRLDCREDGNLVRGARLRWLVVTFSCAAGAEGLERADAAVARRA